MKVQRAIVVILMLALHVTFYIKALYVMGKALSGELFCTLTGLVETSCKSRVKRSLHINWFKTAGNCKKIIKIHYENMRYFFLVILCSSSIFLKMFFCSIADYWQFSVVCA